MVKFTKDEVTFILKALIEHKAKIERMKSYPEQKDNLKPYNSLIRKFVKYRLATFRKTRK